MVLPIVLFAVSFGVLCYALFEAFRRRVYWLTIAGVALGGFLFLFGVAWFFFREPHFPVVAFGLTMAWEIFQWIWIRFKIKDNIKRRVVLVVMRRSSYFGRAMVKAIDRMVRDRIPSVLIEVLESGEDIDTQINDLGTARLREPNAIVLFPVTNNTKLVGVVMDAIKDGIPVITVDRHLPSEEFLQNNLMPPFHVASDFRRGGQIAAEMMLDKLRKKGNIAIIAGTPDAEVSRIRMHAFVGKILEHTPNVTIVSCRYTNWEEKNGRREAKKMKERIKVDGIFCCSDNLALGVAKVIENHDVTIIGYDGIAEARQKIREGKIYGTIDVRIEGQAIRLADELRKIFDNKEGYLRCYHPRDLMVPRPLTQENINSFQSK